MGESGYRADLTSAHLIGKALAPYDTKKIELLGREARCERGRKGTEGQKPKEAAEISDPRHKER